MEAIPQGERGVRHVLTQYMVLILWTSSDKIKPEKELSMRSLSDISKTLEKQKPQLHKSYGVSEIGIFGSYVKNRQNQNSDIDILVSFEKPIGLFAFVRLKNELSSLFECKVDLVMKTALKPRIGKNILTEVLYV
jgi:predicted nucleotidyltransferase